MAPELTPYQRHMRALRRLTMAAMIATGGLEAWNLLGLYLVPWGLR